MIKEKNIMRKEWKNIIFNFLFIAVSILIILSLYNRIIIASLLLIVITISGLIKLKSKLIVVIFIVSGILLGTIEVIIINYNFWSYSGSSILNAPFWLFILWGNTAVFIYQTTKEIKKLGFGDKK